MYICQNSRLEAPCWLLIPANLSMPEGNLMNIDDTGVWPEAILGKMGEGLEIIDNISAKRFSRPAEAEEAAAFVLEKLSENGWKRCQSYQGNAQPRTYLIRVTKNLLEDFSRKKYGRPRPPKWLKDSGRTWVELWTELCKEGRSHLEIVPRFMQRGHERDWIKDTIKIIKAKIPDCGQKLFEARSLEDVSSIKNLSNNDETATNSVGDFSHERVAFATSVENSLIEAPNDTAYAQQGMAEADLLRMVYSIAEVVPSPDSPDAGNLAYSKSTRAQRNSALNGFGQALVFKDIERVVLKMRFKDGLSISAVARALQLKRYDVTVIETTCLKRIREAAIEVGLDFESLLSRLQ